MPLDLVEPVLNSVYLFLGIVGTLGTFVGWLYHLNQKKRQDDKNEVISYVNGKFETVTEMIAASSKSILEKHEHSTTLLNKILNYETKNIKLHIRNLTITDIRLEEDIARIEGVVFYKKDDSLREFRKTKNKKDNIPYSDNQDMEENNTNGF